MPSKSNPRRRARLHAVVAAAAVGIAAAVALPALAHEVSRRVRHVHRIEYVQHDYRHHADAYHEHGERVRVPARISRRSYRTYRHHHRGQAYHAPHRHHHDVYVFPVATPAGVVYRPHYYCGKRLYRVTHRSPRISLSFRF